jgi:hypothetical protein
MQVPSLVQQRVKLWMEYTWRQQKSFNESHILDFLPLKMRTDLALQIHYRTLSKVKLFQDCDSGLLKARRSFWTHTEPDTDIFWRGGREEIFLVLSKDVLQNPFFLFSGTFV